MERAAEACAAAMAGVLPADVVIRVLNPIVKTGEYPVNQAAIKMLTKVAEHEASKEIVVAHLSEIMPGLLRVSIFITFALSGGLLVGPLKIANFCHARRL